MGWKISKYSSEDLYQAQSSVERRKAEVVHSEVKGNECFQGLIVPGDDGNQACPVHPHGECE